MQAKSLAARSRRIASYASTSSDSAAIPESRRKRAHQRKKARPLCAKRRVKRRPARAVDEAPGVFEVTEPGLSQQRLERRHDSETISRSGEALVPADESLGEEVKAPFQTDAVGRRNF